MTVAASVSSYVASRALSVVIERLPRFNWLLGATDAARWTSNGPSTLDAFVESRPHDRFFIFGEQHHQARVLLAQLALLNRLATRPGLRLVLEQFNVLQQPMLDAFTRSYRADESNEDEAQAGRDLVEAYEKDGGESFDIGGHYLPLLFLARGRGVKIIGGFPPRRWAKTIAREGLGAGKRQLADEGFDFDRWDDMKASTEHAAYIRSLIRGTPPVLVDGEQSAVATAQCFKDAVMARTIDDALTGDATVLAICGSGHVEYGFGVPERVRSSRAAVVVAAPDDQELWHGSDWGKESTASPIADAVYFYEAVEEYT